MEKSDVIEIYSQNGEVHLILDEYKKDGFLKKQKKFSAVKIKALMKKEAAKPLLLIRE